MGFIVGDRDVVVAEVRRTFRGRLTQLEERLSTVNEGIVDGGEGLAQPGLEPAADGGMPKAILLPRLEQLASAERRALLAEGASGLHKINRGREDDITPRERVGLEAIIVLEGRPPLFIQGGDFLKTPPAWKVLDSHRQAIKTSIARVGRVEVDGHPDYEWIGTGFLVGADAIVTNRHVAREFSRSDGKGWTFEAGMSARLDFNEEFGALDPLEFAITGILGIHEQYDMAVLKVAHKGGANKALPSPLAVAADKPGKVAGRQVYAIGYPAWDGRRNDPAYMRQIFSDIYDVKRLSPGEITAWKDGDEQFIHDCSTLGGNSGSPVFDLETHQVIGLHFGGRYLSGNNAVPLWKLTQDALLKKARTNFVVAAGA